MSIRLLLVLMLLAGSLALAGCQRGEDADTAEAPVAEEAAAEAADEAGAAGEEDDEEEDEENEEE